MHSKSNQKFNFNIEIKSKGKRLNIPVYQNDNHQTLITRLCQNTKIHSQYQSIVKDKIINQLINKMKSESLKPNLKEKVSNFIIEQSKSKQFDKINLSKTPEKILQNYAKKTNEELNSQIINQQNNYQKIEPFKPFNSIANNLSSENQKNKTSNIKVNNDLALAYKTILNQSKDPNMKIMAKKCLEESKMMRQFEQKKTLDYKENFKCQDLTKNNYQNKQFSCAKQQQQNFRSFIRNKSRSHKFNYRRQSAPEGLLLSKLYDYEQISCDRPEKYLKTNFSKEEYSKSIRNQSTNNIHRNNRYKYAID